MRSKRAAIKLRKAGVSFSTIKAKLKLLEGDRQTLDHGRQPILEGSGAFHAQETGGDHYQGGRDHQMAVCIQYYVKLCMQTNYFSSKFVQLLPEKIEILSSPTAIVSFMKTNQ
jgi:hypothetical protein